MSLSESQKIRRAQKRYKLRMQALADYVRAEMSRDHKPSPEVQAMESLAKKYRAQIRAMPAKTEKDVDKFIPRLGGFRLTAENVKSQGTYIRVCGMRTRSLDELAWKF